MEPKSFLFVTWEGGGNLPPVLGLAARLAERGHRVRVLTEPCLQPTVEKIGAGFIPFQRHFTRTDRSRGLLKDYTSKSPKPALETLFFGPMAITAEETHAALQAEKTDLLLTDCLMPGALIPAEAAGIPGVVLNHMPETLPGPNRPPGVMGIAPGTNAFGRWRDRMVGRLFRFQMNRYRTLVNDVRRSFGLAPLSNVLDLYHRADRRFIQTCRDYDFPIEPAPPNVRYTGPVLDDPDFVEPWKDPWPEDDERPLVVVSFSTTFQDQKPILEKVIGVLGRMDIRGLVTTGPALSGESFAKAPNVEITEAVAHSDVFPRADLVITHCGHGTIMRALASGVPVLGLPMGRDQMDNAIKLVRHGVGLKLSPGSGAAKISAAARKILSTSAFRDQARSLQEKILAVREQGAAIRELEQLAGQTEPATV